MTFDDLLTRARELAATAPAPKKPHLPGSLVYVLACADGSVCSIVNDEFDGSLPASAAVRMVALWKEGGVDLPSYDFRKALLALDAANGEAQILVQSENGLAYRLLKDSL